MKGCLIMLSESKVKIDGTVFGDIRNEDGCLDICGVIDGEVITNN